MRAADCSRCSPPASLDASHDLCSWLVDADGIKVLGAEGKCKDVQHGINRITINQLN